MDIPEDRDMSGIPIICSKCNATFRSDSVHVQVYTSTKDE